MSARSLIVHPGRRQWLRMGIGAGLAMLAGGAVVQYARRVQWRERILTGFGTTLWLRAGHEDLNLLERALDESVAILRHIERQMSLFNPASALVELNRTGRLAQPDADLVRVLSIARNVSEGCDGAFDVSMQPLWDTWSRAHAESRLPAQGEIDAARARVNWRGIAVSANEIRLTRPGMAISLNGIAQGYAGDRVRTHLRERGIEHALLDTGEWSMLGQAPRGEPWTLGIADPDAAGRVIAQLVADGRAIATSSHAHTTFSADRRNHHIVDPRTGWSPPDLASVTVAAPSGALADALTKVVFTAGWDGALRVAAEWGVDVLVIDKDGAVQASPGLALA